MEDPQKHQDRGNSGHKGDVPDSQKLIDYVNGNLDESEAQRIAEVIASSEFESEALEGLKALNATTDVDAAVKSINDIIDQKIAAEKQLQNPGKKIWLRIAAVLVMVASSLFYLTHRELSGEELFDVHFTLYPNMVELSRSSEPARQRLQRAMVSYEEEALDRSLILLEDILEDQAWQSDALFYSAIIRLQSGDVGVATERLNALIAGRDKKYQRPAEWYLCLALTKSAKFEEALKQLQQLRQNSYQIRPEVEMLLKALLKKVR